MAEAWSLSLSWGKGKGVGQEPRAGLSAPLCTHAINLKVLRNPKFEAGLQVIKKVYLQKQEDKDIFCLTV